MSAVWRLSMLLFLIGCRNADGKHALRMKRSILEMERTIDCMEHAGARSLLRTFNCYGCWCGIGGVGEPVDDVDRCCKTHDWCYDELRRRGICSTITGEIYWRKYGFDCSDTGDGSDRYPRCSPTTNDCGSNLCKCDVVFAECLHGKNATQKRQCPHGSRLCFELL